MEPKNREPEISAWFCISGFAMDLEECTRVIGMEPDEVWHRPEMHVGIQGPPREWSIGFRREKYWSTNDAVASVLARIWPLRVRVKYLVAERGYTLTLACNVTHYGDRPLYELSSTVMKQLGELDCEFLMDIYDKSDPE